jgi:hypothetical protein
LHERLRYQSPFSPDVDNILKPLLDAIRGPDGLLVDDCQVQAVSCHWIDWPSSFQRVSFELRYMPDDYIQKTGLVFVHIGRQLYMPLNETPPAKTQLLLLDAWSQMMATSEALERFTNDYAVAKAVTPIQHPFHGSRLRGFKKLEASVVRQQLESQLTSR